jgi:hypothetical protein
MWVVQGIGMDTGTTNLESARKIKSNSRKCILLLKFFEDGMQDIDKDLYGFFCMMNSWKYLCIRPLAEKNAIMFNLEKRYIHLLFPPVQSVGSRTNRIRSTAEKAGDQ